MMKKTINGYDSKLEERHHADLMFTEAAGKIDKIQHQYEWKCVICDQEVFKYTIDFVWRSVKYNKIVADECKAFFSPRDRLRFKAFVAYHLAQGWIIRLQNGMEKHNIFYEIFLYPSGKIGYIDHLDNRKKKPWLFDNQKGRDRKKSRKAKGGSNLAYRPTRSYRR